MQSYAAQREMAELLSDFLAKFVSPLPASPFIFPLSSFDVKGIVYVVLDAFSYFYDLCLELIRKLLIISSNVKI